MLNRSLIFHPLNIVGRFRQILVVWPFNGFRRLYKSTRKSTTDESNTGSLVRVRCAKKMQASWGAGCWEPTRSKAFIFRCPVAAPFCQRWSLKRITYNPSPSHKATRDQLFPARKEQVQENPLELSADNTSSAAACRFQLCSTVNTHQITLLKLLKVVPPWRRAAACSCSLFAFWVATSIASPSAIRREPSDLCVRLQNAQLESCGHGERRRILYSLEHNR